MSALPYHFESRAHGKQIDFLSVYSNMQSPANPRKRPSVDQRRELDDSIITIADDSFSFETELPLVRLQRNYLSKCSAITIFLTITAWNRFIRVEFQYQNSKTEFSHQPVQFETISINKKQIVAQQTRFADKIVVESTAAVLRRFGRPFTRRSYI